MNEGTGERNHKTNLRDRTLMHRERLEELRSVANSLRMLYDHPDRTWTRSVRNFDPITA